MRKGIRVFAAGALLLVLSSGTAAFAASRDSRGPSLFGRFLAWMLASRLSPPIGAPAPESRLSPPIGAPVSKPQGRLSPPIGVTDPPPATTT